MRHTAVLLAMVAFATATAHAQAWREGFRSAPQHTDDITPAQRAAIWEHIDRAQALLVLPKAGPRPTFRWPLRVARGYSNPVFSRVSFHVDHDAAFPGQLRDFACGARTYDRQDGYNHRGTDISIVPDSWNLMAAGQVEIVAAAAGTILSRFDGNFDRNCAFGGGDWNAVYVQHDDGSIAWYGHMKSGSTTPKHTGERVQQGEYLGLVGSSGSSTGPHLHFEVYDAERRLVDPFEGACNPDSGGTWWEQQPPYQQAQLMALTVASSEPIFPTCGADGRVQDPGTYNAWTAFGHGQSVWFVVNARDVPAGARIAYTVRGPTGAVVSQFQGSAAPQDAVSLVFWAGFPVDATFPAGHYMVEARMGDSLVEAPFTVTATGAPITNYSDLWWNPAESGWGLNVNHQGDTVFATWFTYDADGSGMWLVMPAALARPGGGFAGAIYRTTGTPFSQISGSPSSDPSPALVGEARITFNGDDRATFAYTVNGISQQKLLERQRFSTQTRCLQTRGSRRASTSYQDLWWNPSESGWGINLTHQGDVIFATWFTYGADRRGMWLVAPDARRQPTGEFRGRLYRTTGIAFDRINNAPALGTTTDVGEITLTFADGEQGRMQYVVNGISQVKSIQRQVFAAGTPLCR